MAKYDDNKIVRCSFCGKRQDQVNRIIAGQGASYICNECIALCTSILGDEFVPMKIVRSGEIRRNSRTSAKTRGDPCGA